MHVIEVNVSGKVKFSPNGPHSEDESAKGGTLREAFHLAANDESVKSVCEFELMKYECTDVVERPAEITGSECGVCLGNPVRQKGLRVFACNAPFAVLGQFR